jgi:hypothetical protein
LKARTGELTPPGIKVLASAKIFADFSNVYSLSVDTAVNTMGSHTGEGDGKTCHKWNVEKNVRNNRINDVRKQSNKKKRELISFLQILDDPRANFGMNAATTLKRAKTTARRAKDILATSLCMICCKGNCNWKAQKSNLLPKHKLFD